MEYNEYLKHAHQYLETLPVKYVWNQFVSRNTKITIQRTVSISTV